MSMTKQTNINQYRTQIQPALDLLGLADSPAGFLTLLPKLMDKTKKSPLSAPIYRKIVTTLGREHEELRMCKRRQLDWMLSKMKILEEASLKEGLVSVRIVKDAHAFLRGERPEIVLGGSFWSRVEEGFFRACNSVASYGDSRLFNGFATVEVRREVLTFDESPILVEDKKELLPNSVEGRLLIEKMNRGFIEATVYKNYFSDQIMFDVKFGAIKEMIYPKDECEDLMKMTTKNEWKIAVDSSLPQIFRFLIQLSSFSQMKPEPAHQLLYPKDIIGLDELSNQQMLQRFLSGFGDDWNKAPLTRDSLWHLVNRFKMLMEEEILGAASVKRPRQLKNEAREFVQNILARELLHLSKEQKNEKNYALIRKLVWKEAPSYGGSAFQEACSRKLVHNECTKFAKKHHWIPKRGKKRVDGFKR